MALSAMGETGVIGHAAVDNDGLAGDIRGNIRSQHNRHPGYFLSIANTTQWNLLKKVLQSSRIAPHRAVYWSFYGTGPDCQHPDTIRGRFLGESASHHIKA